MERGKVYRRKLDTWATDDWEEFLTLEDPTTAEFVVESLAANSKEHNYAWIAEDGRLYYE